MDYSKFIVSNQKEVSISIQRVNIKKGLIASFMMMSYNKR